MHVVIASFRIKRQLAFMKSPPLFIILCRMFNISLFQAFMIFAAISSFIHCSF